MRLGTQAFAGRSQLDLTSSAILRYSIIFSMRRVYISCERSQCLSLWLPRNGSHLSPPHAYFALVPALSGHISCLISNSLLYTCTHNASSMQLMVHAVKGIISWYTLSEISSGVGRRGRGVRKKEAGICKMAGSALSIDQLLQHLLLLVGDSHCRMLCRVEKVSLATWRPEFQMSPRVPCLRLRLLPIAVSENDGGPSARHYFPPSPSPCQHRVGIYHVPCPCSCA